jgi:hypothetical protein
MWPEWDLLTTNEISLSELFKNVPARKIIPRIQTGLLRSTVIPAAFPVLLDLPCRWRIMGNARISDESSPNHPNHGDDFGCPHRP